MKHMIDKGFKRHPKKKSKKCLQCDGPLKRGSKKFCSTDCYSKNRTITIPKPCQVCGTLTDHKTFCSDVCRYKHIEIITTNCLTCNKQFIFKRAGCYKLVDKLYCSDNCKKRLYKVNQSYFKTITFEVIKTIGVIFCCGWHSDFRTLHVVTSYDMLVEIMRRMGSDYKITKSDRGLYQVEIRSEEIISDLIEMGLTREPMINELPSYDFEIMLEGIRESHVMGEGGVMRFDSSRIAWEVAWRKGLGVMSETFKDNSIGRLSIVYKVFPSGN